MTAPEEPQPPRPEPVSALPSPAARLLAFGAIIVAGACGGLIGWAFADLQCEGECGAATTTGALIGALVAAAGVAIVAVLVLRAMGEWKADQRINRMLDEP